MTDADYTVAVTKAVREAAALVDHGRSIDSTCWRIALAMEAGSNYMDALDSVLPPKPHRTNPGREGGRWAANERVREVLAGLGEGIVPTARTLKIAALYCRP